jgi:signal transduction histidine kinase
VVAGAGGVQWPPVLLTGVGWIYTAAGMVAWSRRPSNRLGLVMVAGGYAVLVSNLAQTQDAVLFALGTAVTTVPLAVVVHLLHAFPSGRLPTAASTVVVVVGYLVCTVLQAPLYLFAPGRLGVAQRPDLAQAGATAQTVVGSAVLLATAVMLAGRLRRATPARRRVLVPLYGYGILAVPLIPLLANLRDRLPGLTAETVDILQLAVLAGIPVAFAFAVLRGGFARTGQIEELGAWLGAAGAGDGRRALAGALARALGDDSLRLTFWVPERDAYVDASGRRMEPAAPGSGRAAVEVELAGRRVGAIEYDPSLIADPEDVRTAGRVVAIAVDRERLTAELLTSKRALKDSRARIVEAGDRERRRIARNLHDGLQVRLVLLAMEAQLVAKKADASPTTRDAATELRVGIDQAAAELRALVHAVMPAGLIERGLSAATEDLVDRVPIPTALRLEITDGSLPPVVESTAYFVIAEAITNALKHARASRLTVRLAMSGRTLRVEVGDDGAGGATLAGGTGLRGLADRVDTLGGRLRIDSATGSGTRITAELPCE